MAIDFITIDKTGAGTKYGTKLERFNNMIREIRDLGEEISGVMGHNAADPDYSGIATKFGITALSAQAVYNLFVAAYARINHADVTSLVDRVG